MIADLIFRTVPIACALLLLRFVAAEAMFRRARRMGSSVRFPVGSGLRITLRLGGPLLMFTAYRMAQHVSSRFDWLSASIVAALGMACLIAEPGQIVMSPTGLVQTRMFGLVKRRILWDGAAASAPNGLREVHVIGNSGCVITHSQYHVGRNEFISQLRLHGVHIQ